MWILIADIQLTYLFMDFTIAGSLPDNWIAHKLSGILKKSVPLPKFEPRSSQSDFINDDLDRSATWLLIEI